MKRRSRPSGRTIRIHRAYTIDEAARETGACRATVRRWLKGGLPSVNDKRPVLILGGNLAAFLKGKPKRQPCQPEECFCLKCRKPRKPALAMADYVPITLIGGNLRAICGVCGTLMHKRIALAGLAALRGILDVAITQQEKHLVDMAKPCLNAHFKKDS